MDTHRLQYFISAAQSLNFSEVARTHFISQPAVSHQIGLLEEELGVPLFVRSGRQLLLTSEGELFLPEAMKILQAMQEGVRLVQRHHQGKSGRISAAVANSNSAPFTRCLELFAERYPQIFVDTTVALGSEQSDVIAKGNFDFCFVAEYLLENNARYDYTVTFNDQFCLAVPKSFLPLQTGDDLSELAKYPFISINIDSATSLYENIRQVCRTRGFEPETIHQYNRIDAVLWSVDAGAGISVVPASIARQYSTDNIEFIPIEGEDGIASCVAAWQNVSKNSAAHKFRDVILELYPLENSAGK
ncbi:MAG: LysR family transcriptional regulator, partial [Clostridiales bacterium]|nr:LysR family transcriptional regulator [Clostridiales bacterium]